MKKTVLLIIALIFVLSACSPLEGCVRISLGAINGDSDVIKEMKYILYPYWNEKNQHTFDVDARDADAHMHRPWFSGDIFGFEFGECYTGKSFREFPKNFVIDKFGSEQSNHENNSILLVNHKRMHLIEFENLSHKQNGDLVSRDEIISKAEEFAEECIDISLYEESYYYNDEESVHIIDYKQTIAGIPLYGDFEIVIYPDGEIKSYHDYTDSEYQKWMKNKEKAEKYVELLSSDKVHKRVLKACIEYIPENYNISSVEITDKRIILLENNDKAVDYTVEAIIYSKDVEQIIVFDIIAYL